jgi:hypothetical protein
MNFHHVLGLQLHRIGKGQRMMPERHIRAHLP